MSKLATPKPPIDPDMSHVIDVDTSAMNDSYDATTLLDKTVPLGELLDEHLARVRTIDYAEYDDISETDEIIELKSLKHLIRLALLDLNFLLCPRVRLWMER